MNKNSKGPLSPSQPALLAESPLTRLAVGVGAPKQVNHFGRVLPFVGFLILLTVAFAKPLVDLILYASRSELCSYIPLIPLVSGYLLWTKRNQLPFQFSSSPRWASLTLLIGIVVLSFYWIGPPFGWEPNRNDSLTIQICAFLVLALCGLRAFAGKELLRAAMFPIFFLIFMVPIPSIAVQGLEHFLQQASADASLLIFRLTGTPVFRHEESLAMPGLVIRVGEECSGIRSSLVLFITSLLAGHLFLKTSWKKAALAFAVIPIGIIRNAARIVSISLLTIYVDPEVIEGPLHSRGGPLFFVFSLVPLFIVLWALRRSERSKPPIKSEANAQSVQGGSRL